MVAIALVSPSGDTSGSTDYASIKAAIDSMSGVAVGTIVMVGEYYVSTPLVNANTNLAICGAGPTRSIITGTLIADSAKYVITTSGPVANLQVTTTATKGLHISGCTYRAALDNVRVWGAIGRGIYADDCWGASFRNTSISYCNGIGMEIYQANRSLLDMVTFNNGDYSGTDECALKIDTCDGTMIRGLNCESLTLNNPAIREFASSGLEFSGMAFEGNTHGGEPVVSLETGSNGIILFDGVRVTTTTQTNPSYFVEAIGDSQVIVNRLQVDSDIDTGIVLLNGGGHTTPQITNCDIIGIATGDWISAINGATMTAPSVPT